MANKKILKKLILAGSGIAGLFIAMRGIANAKKENENIDKGNPYIKNIDIKNEFSAGRYENIVKPVFDRILSFAGLILLSPLYAIISIAIYLDDPGPVFFVQKRVGKDGKFFELHKYRTMLLSAPHDVPTHQLEDPLRYITRIGHFLRKTSLDEIPQIWDIFRGKMSIIGPRPALWNQEDLIAEREKYCANNILPGLTGWAQINGRDELRIPEKAKLDGEYVSHLKKGGLHALLFDVKCFLGTITLVLERKGVVEGGTGESKKSCSENQKREKKRILVICQYYYPENFQITPICEKLVQDGYAVTVLTGLPNYPIGIVADEYRYGHRNENINGVHVIRCYEAGRKKNILSLAWNYTTFTISALKKVDKFDEIFDVVFCYQLSPVFMGLPALKYAKKHNIPLFIYCCDLWPESIKVYIKKENNLVFQLVKRISSKIYQAADIVIVQSTSFIDYLNKVHGINRDKMVYVPAFADETYLTSDFRTCNDTVNFVFLGNLGVAQDLISVLEAINRIKELSGFKVHFVGDGICYDEMKKFVKQHGLEEQVHFYGRRPVEEMPVFYKLADACLVSLKADNAIGLTLPSKVQGYMAAGKPIIAMIDGSAKEVIKESGCGVCVGAGDIVALSEAMKDFIIHKDSYIECGKKGREYFKRNFAKDRCISKLEEIIEKEYKKNVVI